MVIKTPLERSEQALLGPEPADAIPKTIESVIEPAARPDRPKLNSKPSWVGPPPHSSVSSSGAAMSSRITVQFQSPGLLPPVYITTTLSNPQWEPIQMDIAKHDNEYVFRKDFDAVEGEHQYKFRLGPGDWWVCDESKPTVDDGFGNRNNKIKVSRQDTPQKKDSIIEPAPSLSPKAAPQDTPAMTSTVPKPASTIADQATNVATVATDYVKPAVSAATYQVKATAATAVEQVKAAASATTDQAKSTASTTADQMKPAASALTEQVKSATSTAADQVRAAASVVTDQTKSTIPTAADQTQTIASAVIDQAKSTTSTTAEQMKPVASAIIDQAKSTTSTTAEQMKPAVATATDQVKGPAVTAANQVKSAVTAIAEQAIPAITTAVDQIRATGVAVTEQAKPAVSAVTDQIKSATQPVDLSKAPKSQDPPTAQMSRQFGNADKDAHDDDDQTYDEDTYAVDDEAPLFKHETTYPGQVQDHKRERISSSSSSGRSSVVSAFCPEPDPHDTSLREFPTHHAGILREIYRAQHALPEDITTEEPVKSPSARSTTSLRSLATVSLPDVQEDAESEDMILLIPDTDEPSPETSPLITLEQLIREQPQTSAKHRHHDHHHTKIAEEDMEKEKTINERNLIHKRSNLADLVEVFFGVAFAVVVAAVAFVMYSTGIIGHQDIVKDRGAALGA